MVFSKDRSTRLIGVNTGLQITLRRRGVAYELAPLMTFEKHEELIDTLFLGISVSLCLASMQCQWTNCRRRTASCMSGWPNSHVRDLCPLGCTGSHEFIQGLRYQRKIATVLPKSMPGTMIISVRASCKRKFGCHAHCTRTSCRGLRW